MDAITTHRSPLTSRDWLLVAALFALVLPLRLWLIHNTEVTTRDSIGYIRYALEFERKPWQEVLRGNHQHPGYPVLVLLVSQPLRAMDGETTPENMELSCQLVNLIASLLLVVPMYLLGRQLFDRTISFGAALLYQYLPISAQHLSDGASEPVYLLMLVSGLLQMVHAVRERSIWRCQLCGMFAGLAYLVRPEGALILPAFGLMLLAMQFVAAWRGTWQRTIEAGASVLVCAALVGSVYFVTVGHFSNKPTYRVIVEQEKTGEASNARPGLPLFAAAVPKSENDASLVLRSGWALGVELNQGFHYVAGAFAVLGLINAFGTLKRDPSFWALAIYAGLLAAVLIRLGMIAHYISDRHVMILVLLGSYFAVFGMRELPCRILAWWTRKGEGRVGEAPAEPVLPSGSAGASPSQGSSSRAKCAAIAFVLLFLGMIAFSLPKGTQRLHGNRAENHAAGRWLAEQLKAHPEYNAVILDDHAWSHFFSGLIFQEGCEPRFPRDHPSKCFIVTTRSRDPQADLARAGVKILPDAVIVWPTGGDLEHARVVVRMQPRLFEESRWPTPK